MRHNDTVMIKYFSTIKWLAGSTILLSALFEAYYNPGPLDAFNGAAVGLVIYALWRS